MYWRSYKYTPCFSGMQALIGKYKETSSCKATLAINSLIPFKV